MKDNSIGMELRSLNNLIMRYVENHFHKKTVDTITGTNGWIIGYIADNEGKDIYQKDLEKEFSVTRSTASKVINLMVKKNLIERQQVPHDARLKKLVLTERAKKLSAIMYQDKCEMNNVLTKGFTHEELETLHAYIHRMKENLRD